MMCNAKSHNPTWKLGSEGWFRKGGGLRDSDREQLARQPKTIVTVMFRQSV